MTPTKTESPIASIRALVADDLQAVDQLIAEQIESRTPLSKHISAYILSSGGKRLRPIITLLIAKALHYKGTQHIVLATLIEFIHTATLLHDDVVDASDMRRGNPTANSVWGNEASVLVGDFLYSRCFQLLTQLDNLQAIRLLADTTNIIAEGEIMQLVQRHHEDTTQAQYMDIIQSKTAKLFEGSSHLAAELCSNSTPAQRIALKNYGLHLGTAFQLIDDALDYTSDTETLGKNIGDDLAEGKATLPLIHALQHGSSEQKSIIKDAIIHGGLDKLDAILVALKETKAIEHTLALAEQHAEQAMAELACLPESVYRTALHDLAEFSIQRKF